MLARRIIPCLDVKDGRVVKGVRFVALRDAGDPVEAAEAYDLQGADELCFLDISASHEGRGTLLRMVERVAARLRVPFSVGGGVRTVEDLVALLKAGADKVVINTAAVSDPEVVRAAAERVGSQCVVAAVDARRVSPDQPPLAERRPPAWLADHPELALPERGEGGATHRAPAGVTRGAPAGVTRGAPAGATRGAPAGATRGAPAGATRGAPAGVTRGAPATDAPPAESAGRPRFEVYTHGGRVPTGIDAVAWCRHLDALGAGEILLTSMDRDGTREGYDLELTRAVVDAVRVPVIASGGVGGLEHLAEGLVQGGADAVLAASVFHFGELTVPEVKRHLLALRVPVRPPRPGLGVDAALEAVRFDDRGLVPVVAQSVADGAVLMVAWADRAALARTLRTGLATYWSRSRGEQWVKGLTSGNVQEVEEVRLDCDGDTVLYRVRPAGPACHQGTYTCFSRVLDPETGVGDVPEER